MSDVLHIRDIETDVVARAKSRAALARVSLKDWVLEAIEEKLARGMGPTEGVSPLQIKDEPGPLTPEERKMLTEADSRRPRVTPVAPPMKHVAEKKKECWEAEKPPVNLELKEAIRAANERREKEKNG